MDTRWKFQTTGLTTTLGSSHDTKSQSTFNSMAHVKKYQDENGKIVHSGRMARLFRQLHMMCPIPGYGTKTTNNLRLWSSKASSGEFDFQKFNAGDYESAVADQQRAETISAVLYPNDNLERGKELRLKQQYFWCAASLFDIVRRFKKTKRAWSEFPDQVAIQLNDTHPTLAIVELQRILIDMEGLEWDEAWNIVTKTFGYTNHTVLPEALEKWSVPLMQNLAPSAPADHLRDQSVLPAICGAAIPQGPRHALARLHHRRVAAQDGAHGLSGHHRLSQSQRCGRVALRPSSRPLIFKDFVEIYGPDKFTNVTNGITPRRWLHQANPRLSALDCIEAWQL